MNNAEKELYDNFYRNPNISEREKYKYYTQNDAYALKAKEKVKKLVAESGLTSVMNDTKWLKLQNAVKTLPFPPPYFEKLVGQEYLYKDEKTPSFLGDWSLFYEEGMPLFFAIEYIRVIPRYSEYSGRLVAPKIKDETQEFEQLLKELHIPYEEEDGVFIIYGYK